VPRPARALVRILPVLLVALSGLPASAQDDAAAAVPGKDRPLRVGTKVVRPFAFRNAEGQWTGISIDLWQEIARSEGYVFEWMETPDTNTLVEEVASGRLDVGIAAITMKPERANRVDFSNSMFRSGLGIATGLKAPGALSSLSVLVSGPFLRGVGALVGVLLLVGVLVWFFERRRNPDHFEPDPRAGLWSAFWWSAVTMTTVGYGDKAPRTVGGRIVALIWMYASIITISSFTAVIASSLTTNRLEARVENAEDLNDVRVGAKVGESPMEILERRGVRAIPYESIEEGMDALAAGRIDAFVHDQPVLQYELQLHPAWSESITVLPKTIREEEYGIAVRPTPGRRNDLREDINAAMLEVKISGRLGEIERQYLGS
jgi:ABC-type amino acid transport substrate-binding protein